MRMIGSMLVAILTLVVFTPAGAHADAATVISATATSTRAGAASIICLLDPGCKGSWSPGSLDSGANEGVYVQFESPIPADFVELTTSLNDRNAPFTLSINGAPATRQPGAVNPNSQGQFAARYAAAGGRVKSIFFRLGVRKGGWQDFRLSSIRFYSQAKPVDLKLPVLVPASVSATSVLEPAVAYQPANLFDSRYDFAWSTNGKITKGKGESLEIKFDQPQNLSGMMVWNGYQRSDEHFKANGRVARLSVTGGSSSAIIVLGDKMGGQKIPLALPLKNVSSIKLTLDEIAPGAKYPDVLLSELRLIDDHDQILIPQVKGLAPAASPLTQAVVDRSLSSVVCSVSGAPGDSQRSLRVRGDGSFVIYGKAYDEEERKKTDQVLEGNWELLPTGIRIFGKRYSETVIRTDYSRTARKLPASIFQSELKIARFHDLTAAEKQQLAALIWTRIAGKVEDLGTQPAEILGPGNTVVARGAGEKTLLAELVKKLETMNPWTVSSPVLADAMLPSDDVGPCAAF